MLVDCWVSSRLGHPARLRAWRCCRRSDDGTPNVGAVVGPGVLSVVRSQEKLLQPFTGTVEITSGEIAEDLAVYLRDSEQVRCKC
jgi:redox-regulated HSP33 family molecular chaperone